MAKTKDRNAVKGKVTGTGVKPEISGFINDANLRNLFNWNRVHKDHKWAKAEIVKRNPELSKLPEWEFSTTIGTIAEILNNDQRVRADVMLWYVGKLDALGNRVEVGKKKSAKSLKESPKALLIAQLEEVLDNTDEKFDVVAFLLENSATGPQVKAVADYYQPQLDFLVNDVAKDAELKKSFARGVVTKQKRILTKFLSACEQVSNVAKAQRKPRKAKKARKINTGKIVDKLTYQEKHTHDDVTVASTNPEKIFGAKMVLLLNTKYNRMTLLESKEGFTIKGQTIQGIDEKTSMCKSVGWYLNMAMGLAQSTPAKIRRDLKKLKTKGILPVTGRIGKDTLIMKVVK